MSERQADISNRAVKDHRIKNQLINQLTNRFRTYGYQQIHTPTFEDYDMYASIQQTVNKDEMIKVIDRNGKVLVLRPDGTIPITRLTAKDKETNHNEQRLFYVFNVYRHNADDIHKESTQAGVEFFGNDKPEADAEIIALAVETLKEIGFQNFKIEIGHAGFFKELIEKAKLTESELQQLQELIQSKNMVEMKPFLKDLNLDEKVQEALYAIPLLYGNPGTVLEETKAIIQTEYMQQILNNLTNVTTVLADYGVLDAISLNLGLINNMDYYTDIIFQGFVENTGKPVLMGGRYNQLSKQFGKDMPAIGFAYEVDFLLEAMQQHKLHRNGHDHTPLKLAYNAERRKDAFSAAEALRKLGFSIITEAVATDETDATISFLDEKTTANGQPFETTEELLELIATKNGGA